MTQTEIRQVEKTLSHQTTAAAVIRGLTGLSHEVVYSARAWLEARGRACLRPMPKTKETHIYGWEVGQ